MSVSSVFDMRFAPEDAQEGFDLSLAIGADMTTTTDCTGYDVIRDLADPGHVVIVTRWSSRGGGEDVLAAYHRDPKIARVTQLLGHSPAGFLGDLAAKA